MNYEHSLAFARKLDQDDPLHSFREHFLIPKHQGKEIIYLCGNSLGLQPKSAKSYLEQQLNNWQNLAVEGWFEGDSPWMYYHKDINRLLAPVVGAMQEEVTVMNSLSVNLHLLMVSFYRPTTTRYKILMEAGAFPSDQYAVESQVRFHGFDPADAVIEIKSKEGTELLETSDILQAIEEHKDELALVLFGGINYYTGQFFDLATITQSGQAAGAKVGFDLAHAAGNVELKLHEWGVDFACWCSYKYMNSSPGGISGVFIHQKHFNTGLDRFAGWWGYNEEKRFKMAKGFEAGVGAEGWQLSCSPVMLMAIHKASLELIARAGGIQKLREKSRLLTGYLEFEIGRINTALGYEQFRIISPKRFEERGCQLSVIAKDKAKLVFDGLVRKRVVGDWREPDVIRLSPVPLYNSFTDVYQTAQAIEEVCKELF